MDSICGHRLPVTGEFIMVTLPLTTDIRGSNFGSGTFVVPVLALQHFFKKMVEMCEIEHQLCTDGKVMCPQKCLNLTPVHPQLLHMVFVHSHFQMLYSGVHFVSMVPVQGDVTVNQSKVVESNHLYALRKHFCPDVSCIVQDCSASIHSRTGLTKLTTSVTFWTNVYESTFHHPTPLIFIVHFSFIITTETQKSFITCSFGDSFMKTHHISKL